MKLGAIHDDGRRTWLGPGKDGAPSSYEAEKNGVSLTGMNAPVLA